MKYFLISGFLIFNSAISFGQIDYTEFNSLLQKHVSIAGKVDYVSLKKEIKSLDKVVADLVSVNLSSLKGKNEELAFWINLYNAGTLQLIASKFPIKSIKDLDGGKTWDVKRIKVGSKSYSLNDIENTKIRTFKDPRIHFAVNCGAKSCPPLLNEAFTAAKLEQQLDKQAKKFVNSSNSTKISNTAVSISQIFDWYGADFGNVITFLNKYSTTKINSDAKISYLAYDWSLNN